MKVSDLTSFDKIKEVVEEMGLAYNNENSCYGTMVIT